jgi:hypothetical protein
MGDKTLGERVMVLEAETRVLREELARLRVEFELMSRPAEVTKLGFYGGAVTVRAVEASRLQGG